MLTRSSRQGFTLTELMIAAVLMLIVGGAAYQLLTTTQRLTRAQVEQVGLQANVRTGTFLVTSELRELSTMAGGSSDENDLLQVAPSDITYRAMRGIGFLCQVPNATQLRIGRLEFSGYRDPQAGRDSLYLFIEGSPDTGNDDRWLPLPITHVSPAMPCPGGRAGITLSVPSQSDLPRLEVGTPVRIFEVMQLRRYQSEGRWWMGIRSLSGGEALQPVLGPLAALHLEYLDGQGAPSADPTGITNIRLTVRGVSAEPITAGTGAAAQIEEALTTQVALRNAPGQ